jgi:transketolase
MTIVQAARDTEAIITVEDHYAEGGLGEAVLSVIAGLAVTFHQLAVRTIPRSGKPDELLDLAGISRRAIVQTVKDLSKRKKQAK